MASTITVRLDTETHTKIKELSEKYGLTISKVIEFLINSKVNMGELKK